MLSACVHAGLVEEGEKHFTSMLTKYGIQAEMEHYTCMVDLYGRAGRFDEALKSIRNMPFEPAWCCGVRCLQLVTCIQI